MDPEDIKLLQAIKAMGIKPKTDTPQDFERSMKEYFRQKEEFDDKKPHSLTLPPDVRPKEKIQPAPYQPPRCSTPCNSFSISTLLAALPYMLSSLCSNSSMEASGPSRITTAPVCENNYIPTN
jgi:hypothetical protein